MYICVGTLQTRMKTRCSLQSAVHSIRWVTGLLSVLSMVGGKRMGKREKKNGEAKKKNGEARQGKNKQNIARNLERESIVPQ